MTNQQRFQVPMSQVCDGYCTATIEVQQLQQNEKTSNYICIDNRKAKLVLQVVESKIGFDWMYFQKNCNVNTEAGAYVRGDKGKVFFCENKGNRGRGKSLGKGVLVTKLSVYTKKYIIEL
jgi:hypothetical protein